MNSISEECVMCGSTNRIPLYQEDALAYECWNCGQCSWLSECQPTYQLMHNITAVQAHMDLEQRKVPTVDGEFNG